MDEEWKEFEDLLYGLQQEVREEMKHHFFRFVQLEQKFQELGKKLIDVQIQLGLKKDADALNSELGGQKVV